MKKRELLDIGYFVAYTCERAKEKLLNHLSYFIVDNAFTSSIASYWIERIKERIKKQETKYSKRKGHGGRGSKTRWAGYVTEIDRTRVAHTRGKRRRKSSAIKSQYTAGLKFGARSHHRLIVSVLSLTEIRKRG